MNKNRIIMFSHIPKTAGTSLKFLLRRYFGLRQLDAIFNKNAKDFSYRPDDLRSDIKLYRSLDIICGHCIKPYVNFLEYETRMEWFTFLRNPAERFISHYIHQQTSHEKYLKMDLIDWSKKFKRNDVMVRMIAGCEDVEKAKDMLHTRFKFIGLTEEFNKSIELMKNSFELHGFDLNLKSNKMQIRSNNLKSNIKDNYSFYEETIYQNNKLDIELYEYFLKYLWKDQLVKYSEFNEKNIIVPHNLNRCLGFLNRNLLYKPYAKFKNQLR